MHQQAPARASHPVSRERQQQPLLPGRLGEPLAHQRHPQPGAGGILQQARIGEVEPLGAQLQILSPLQGPVVPVHLPLPVQCGALRGRLCQHRRGRHRQQPIRQQQLVATLGLGYQIAAQRQIHGECHHDRQPGYLSG
ncbi:hypothetical protein D3C80_1533520 [compost metagenome]